MGKKRFTPEQIIGKLREAEVALAQGETAGQAAPRGCKPHLDLAQDAARLAKYSRDRQLQSNRVGPDGHRAQASHYLTSAFDVRGIACRTTEGEAVRPYPEIDGAIAISLVNMLVSPDTKTMVP